MINSTNENEKILIDENGEETLFEHVLTFLYEKERYIALSPIIEEDDADEEAEIVLLKIVSENGEDKYVSIDNEVLLNEVFDEFLEIVDELEGEE